jgi:HEAT repeat protein
MAHFFISYSHQDREFVTELKKRMRAAGLLPWTDEDIVPGEAWSIAIDNAIRESDGVIVVISFNSLQSPWVIYEWSFAMGINNDERFIVPIMLELPDPTNENHPKFHDKLAARQFIDFQSNMQWDRLVDRLKSMKFQTVVPAPVKAAVLALDSHTDADISQGIARLEQINSPEALEALAQAANGHPTPNVRYQAAFALGRLSKNTDMKAIPGLITGIKLGDHTTRLQALNDLRDLKAIQAVPEIEALLISPDTDHRIRNEAIAVLGNLHSDSSVSILREFLTNNSFVVRQLASHALTTMNDFESIPAIVEAIAGIRSDDYQSIGARNAILNDLQHFGPQTIPALKVLLEDSRQHNQEDAIRLLGRIGSETAVSILNDIYNDRSNHTLQSLAHAALEDIRKRS